VIWCASCGSDASEPTASCVVGHQTECPCPGGGKGVQVCNADGKSYSACDCDPGTGGVTGSGGWATGGGQSGGAGGTAGAAGVTTGGTAGSAGADAGPVVYSLSDCIQSPRNGSEVCDDEGWQVQSPGKPLVLVCLDANGGTIYLANNTGPKMSDGVARCQGWETNQQNAWDYLDYLFKLECDSDQKMLDVDLSAKVGSTVYMGVHDNPAGGGHGTQSCFAWKK